MGRADGLPPIDVHSLMAAVLKRAIQDYHLSVQKSVKKAESKAKEEALQYIECDSRHLFSFRNICATLGMDYRKARHFIVTGKVVLAADNRKVSRRCAECGIQLNRHNDLGVCRKCITLCYGGSRVR